MEDKKKIAVCRWQLKMRTSETGRIQSGYFIGRGRRWGRLAPMCEMLSGQRTMEVSKLLTQKTPALADSMEITKQS